MPPGSDIPVSQPRQPDPGTGDSIHMQPAAVFASGVQVDPNNSAMWRSPERNPSGSDTTEEAIRSQLSLGSADDVLDAPEVVNTDGHAQLLAEVSLLREYLPPHQYSDLLERARHCVNGSGQGATAMHDKGLPHRRTQHSGSTKVVEPTAATRPTKLVEESVWESKPHAAHAGMFGRLPEPSSGKAEKWKGDGAFLADHLRWFNELVSPRVAGKDKIELYLRYVDPTVRFVLEDALWSDGIVTWQAFENYLHDNFLDRSRLATLSYQEFEEEVKLMAQGGIESYEDVVKFSHQFGSRARQFQRGQGEVAFVNELYCRYIPQELFQMAKQQLAYHWATDLGWNPRSIPHWTWVRDGVKEVLHPENQLGAMELRHTRPDLPTQGELNRKAQTLKMSSGSLRDKSGDKILAHLLAGDDLVLPGRVKPALQVEKLEQMDVDDLTKRMRTLEISSKSGSAKERRQAAQEYATVHAYMVQAYPRVAKLWPSSVVDVYAEGEHASTEAAKAWQVLGQKGIDSVEYRTALSHVLATAPPGLQLGLPAPRYNPSVDGVAFRAGGGGAPPVQRQVQNMAVTTTHASSQGARRFPSRPPGAVSRPRWDDEERLKNILCYFCGVRGHIQPHCGARKVAEDNGWVYTGVLTDEHGNVRRELRWNIDDPRYKDKPVAQDPATRTMMATVLRVAREAKLIAEGQTLTRVQHQHIGDAVDQAGPYDLQQGEILWDYSYPDEYGVTSYSVQLSGSMDVYSGEILSASSDVDLSSTRVVEALAHKSSTNAVEAEHLSVFMVDTCYDEFDYIPDLGEEEYEESLEVQRAMVHHIASNWDEAAFQRLAAFAVTRTDGPDVRQRPYPTPRQPKPSGSQLPARSVFKPKTAPLSAQRSVNFTPQPWPKPKPSVEAKPLPVSESVQKPAGVSGRKKDASAPSKTNGLVRITPKVDKPLPVSDDKKKSPSKDVSLEKLAAQPYSRLRLRDCQLTKGVNWRAVCEKIVYTHALRDGLVTTVEVLSISPILGKFIELGLRPISSGKEPDGYQAAQAYLMEVGEAGEDITDDDLDELYQDGSGDSTPDGPSLRPGEVVISEARVNYTDRELVHVNEVAYNQSLPQTEPSLKGGEIWNDFWEGPLPLTVRTVLLEATVCRVPCRVIVDDGSQINMVSGAFYDRICQRKHVAIRTDVPYHVSGVHGNPQRLAGYFEAELVFGGLATKHIFWVNPKAPEDKVFLGMPFILRNQVNFYWSGNRRILHQTTERGQTELAMHPSEGPLLTVMGFTEPRKPVFLRLSGLRQVSRENSLDVNQEILFSNAITVEDDVLAEVNVLSVLQGEHSQSSPPEPKPFPAMRAIFGDDFLQGKGKGSCCQVAATARGEQYSCTHSVFNSLCCPCIVQHFMARQGCVHSLIKLRDCGHWALESVCPACWLRAAEAQPNKQVEATPVVCDDKPVLKADHADPPAVENEASLAEAGQAECFVLEVEEPELVSAVHYEVECPRCRPRIPIRLPRHVRRSLRPVEPTESDSSEVNFYYGSSGDESEVAFELYQDGRDTVYQSGNRDKALPKTRASPGRPSRWVKEYGRLKGKYHFTKCRGGHLRVRDGCPACWELITEWEHERAVQQTAEALADKLFDFDEDASSSSPAEVNAIVGVDKATNTEETLWESPVAVQPADDSHVSVLGVYKPVHLKKRPVDTAMREEDKPLMTLPEDLLSDLPEIDVTHKSWTDLPPGKRLNAERLEAVMSGVTEQGF